MELIRPIMHRAIETLEKDEIWLPLKCFDIMPGRYEISSFGRIHNLKTNSYSFGDLINSGYLVVAAYTIYGESKHFLVHRLVMQTFFPKENPEDFQVNHDTCCKTINCYKDLSWMTPKENCKYSYDMGTNTNYGENLKYSVLTETQVIKICELLEQGWRYRDILVELGFDTSNENNFDLIGNIYRRIAWKRVSENYTFPIINQNFRCHSEDEIRFICQCIANGDSHSEIYEKLNPGEKYSFKEHKQFYEFIRRLRKKEHFSQIANEYF